MYMQDILQTLDRFWSEKGCILWQPYHTEVGAGTSNPATFLRVLGPEPWWVAYPEPSTRPADGRYGENPNRLQHYYQYQVILKPSPPEVQELFLQSLEALGLDLTKHDFRFVEDNWQSPSLGAWGLGWEAWLDGMEILQFTYFQECGGCKLDVRACELTYGIERIAMYIQGVESVYDLKWAPSGITYGDIFHAQEVEYCKYNFEAADTEKLFHQFDMNENEGKRLLDEGLILPAYDHCLRLSHLFNLLDARGALSVSERGRFLLRCRTIAEGCAKGFLAQREAMGFPLMRLPVPGREEADSAQEVAAASLNDTDTLLLEIGVEEMPHKDAQAVIKQAPSLVDKILKDQGFEHGAVEVSVTPRRIAVQIADMPAKQPDVDKEVRGPKKKAAIDDDGSWKIPAQKFAEGNGISVDDIYFQEQGKFEYCFAKVHQKGEALGDVLSEIIAKLLKGLQFGKSMGWEDGTATFSRPVRWLLALHGANVVPASWKLRDKSEIGPERMLTTGRVTYGHRRLAPGPVEVATAADYASVLRDRGVLLDRDERMQVLRDGVAAEAESRGLVPEWDDALFEEIVDIGEWPEPIVGTIPEDALELPEPIIITPMKVHQRYIPLRTKDGALSQHFVAVANGIHTADGVDLIREGNERVLNARLRDAKYFWDTDTKTPLGDFAEGLSRVQFHRDLGTVADKVARIRTLYENLKGQLPTVDDAKIGELFGLMKADLTTQMVFELDSLQGMVGMLYAKKQGIDGEIADAIFEHWLPRRAGDKLPTGSLGLVAGILDRLDSLAGYFGVGIRPKGTSDPFGLRRNALAVLTLVESAELDVDLAEALKAALATYGDLVKDPADALDALLAFFKDRLDVLARDEGYAYDRVAAALANQSE
ncbi:MAG: glycine--tRNA ligase subunit beta, partial [bacterium]|nr:glycine--tRNA ligase subunit beta [bacterium]